MKVCFNVFVITVDQNMARAQKRDAACSGEFYFRKDVLFRVLVTLTISPPSCSGSYTPVEGEGQYFAMVSSCSSTVVCERQSCILCLPLQKLTVVSEIHVSWST
ncbi:hypothetical protein BDR07DRAFT_1415289 [Suillus spraguei]|nr:hypothetical protein BDR07DRAFT_1415289 [Suillus spraguei]